MTHCKDCGTELTISGYHPGSGGSSDRSTIVCLTAQLKQARDHITHLESACAKQAIEIEQMCGQALGYPWFKDDQKNFPGATEADGVIIGEHVPETIVAELVAAFNKLKENTKV